MNATDQDILELESRLESITVGCTTTIGGLAVTRWTDKSWEVGGWGKETRCLVDTVALLMDAMRGQER